MMTSLSKAMTTDVRMSLQPEQRRIDWLSEWDVSSRFHLPISQSEVDLSQPNHQHLRKGRPFFIQEEE
ncbi:unnamed protein product [Rhodiola kirilowii]